MSIRLRHVMLSAWLCAALAPVGAMAEGGHTDAGNEDPGEASQRHFSMHQLSKKPPLPRLHMDYGQYRYIPEGDKIKEQPDMNRLLFWTKGGEPDGYAERRGSAILYYDRTGKAVRVDTNPPQ
nr:hypothetical protein [Komagataeibacter melaceti]